MMNFSFWTKRQKSQKLLQTLGRNYLILPSPFSSVLNFLLMMSLLYCESYSDLPVSFCKSVLMITFSRTIYTNGYGKVEGFSVLCDF